LAFVASPKGHFGDGRGGVRASTAPRVHVHVRRVRVAGGPALIRLDAAVGPRARGDGWVGQVWAVFEEETEALRSRPGSANVSPSHRSEHGGALGRRHRDAFSKKPLRRRLLRDRGAGTTAPASPHLAPCEAHGERARRRRHMENAHTGLSAAELAAAYEAADETVEHHAAAPASLPLACVAARDGDGATLRRLVKEERCVADRRGMNRRGRQPPRAPTVVEWPLRPWEGASLCRTARAQVVSARRRLARRARVPRAPLGGGVARWVFRRLFGTL
jgi:hypothetical protein